MATDLKSSQELYDDAQTSIQSQDSSLTDFSEGSILDIITGMATQGVSEIQRVALLEFAKTYLDTANGPEVTGGDDDLQRLAVDHYGSSFARPQATQSAGIVTFSRPSTTHGAILIPSGTVVKTAQNALGTVQRLQTTADLTLTGLTSSVTAQAILAGSAGNVAAGAVTVIESTLTDATITVSNTQAFSGGTEAADDSTYREFIRNQLVSLRGATMAAVTAEAETVPGVATVFGQEVVQTVIPWDTAALAPVGDAFQIVRPYLYVADANGTASTTLLQAVLQAINTASAAGVQITVLPAQAISQNVSASLTYSATGPNVAALAGDPSPILNNVEDFINALPIGTGLVRSGLRTYILGIWGVGGTGDLVDFQVVVPTGDINMGTTQKLIPGTVKAV